ncbi:hypothetical protein [Streptomyces sp. NPDC058620]|uniref:hypothetical protein n=1 Tax=Streptomyces sp. NPDC058620 TaxID=3346560 RepID=UPI003646123F
MNVKPLIQPLGDGTVILYDRITGWVTSPKYRTPAPPEPLAEKPQPAKGQQKAKADQAADSKIDQKKPAAVPEPELDKRAPLKRVGLLLGGAYVLFVSDYTTYATAAAALGWVLAAYMVGAPDKPPSEAAQDVPAAAPKTPRDAIVQWLIEVIGDRPGVHFAELYPRMRELPGMEKYDDAALRGALNTLGITVTRTFTIGKAKGLSGVRLADLTTPLPSQEKSPLSTGEDAGETTRSTPEERPESGPSSAEEPVREKAL